MIIPLDDEQKIAGLILAARDFECLKRKPSLEI